MGEWEGRREEKDVFGRGIGELEREERREDVFGGEWESGKVGERNGCVGKGNGRLEREENG